MATPVVFNAVSYSVPAFGDVGYAQGPGNLSSYLIALATGTLQPTGGLFSLTADANFGPNFGLVALYYKTTTANIATAGQFRLANTDTIDWRNFANSANLPLAVNTSDQLTFNGVVISTAAAGGTVNAGTINTLTYYAATGNTVSSLTAITANRVLISDANGLPIANAALTASRALASDASGFPVASVTTAAELAFVNGVTSSIQTQLNTKATDSLVVHLAGSEAITGVKTFSAGAGAITMSGSTIAMGANKITGLANGTSATDAAAFGQIQSPTVTYFTASGTFTTPADSSTTTRYVYKIVGGGGGAGGTNAGAAASGGGGAGATAEGTFTGVAANTAITVTVGGTAAGGTTAGTNGTAGNASTIGTPVSITAGGGAASNGTTSASGVTGGGAGGTTTGGPPLASPGGSGTAGTSPAAASAQGGHGGGSSYGSGGPGGQGSIAGPGTAGNAYGSGGGGAVGGAAPGGGGAQGVVIITRLTA